MKPIVQTIVNTMSSDAPFNENASPKRGNVMEKSTVSVRLNENSTISCIFLLDFQNLTPPFLSLNSTLQKAKTNVPATVHKTHSNATPAAAFPIITSATVIPNVLTSPTNGSASTSLRSV